ncbi:MAG: sodium-dependent bicarbonate transport family permease [Burkholderiales bacterium]|nr:sodium-dependent bicarbonate transport family permease [Burkholderiales bacterium]
MTMDPVVLFFILGVIAKLAKSDLRLPDALYEALSIYLLLAIGIKGGVELAQQPIGTVLPQALAAMALGAAIPFMLYPVLHRLGRLPAADSASIAAHYGSVSVVTFAVALSYLIKQGVPSESYAPLLVAVMEAPGIIAGIVLARRALRTADAPLAGRKTRWGELAHEVLFGKSVLLLLGGLVIGTIAGPQGIKPIEPVFMGMFKGVLALFLLEMGLVAGARLGDLKRAGMFLVVFGVAAPMVLGVFGAVVGHLIGLSLGGTAIFATLAASASYIAAPTAMRIAVPEANPALSIGVALGVTFPFNITLGIPLYLQYARWITT